VAGCAPVRGCRVRLGDVEVRFPDAEVWVRGGDAEVWVWGDAEVWGGEGMRKCGVGRVGVGVEYLAAFAPTLASLMRRKRIVATDAKAGRGGRRLIESSRPRALVPGGRALPTPRPPGQIARRGGGSQPARSPNTSRSATALPGPAARVWLTTSGALSSPRRHGSHLSGLRPESPARRRRLRPYTSAQQCVRPRGQVSHGLRGVRSRAGALRSQPSRSSSESRSGWAPGRCTLTAASRLPHQTSAQTVGSACTAVRMPGSSTITFMCSPSHSVAKIRPPTRNEGRPW
jgi:hypothetical protein